jgi:hypothetical protein
MATEDLLEPDTEEGGRQVGYLAVLTGGLAILLAPAGLHVLFLVFALPALWELQSR